MSILSNLKPPAGSKKSRVRVGRGTGCGLGKTAGRGQKGQKARCGHRKPAFEGGQTPMGRRVPKLGFKNNHALRVANVNVGALDVFDANSVVTIEALREKRLVRGAVDTVKILGDGELAKKLTVKAHAFSAGARAKIEQAGGAAEVLAGAAG
ncbi:MAG: 50S ribosomal protein L15 [Deltaproteobacteria bacterium]|nr:50S ribosomal protein L15 [Deltaproteobacteria bacterium]